MSNLGILLLSIVGAILLDVVLIRWWRKRSQRLQHRRSPEIRTGEQVQAAHVQLSIDLAEGDTIQLTIEALPSEPDIDHDVVATLQLTIDEIDAQTPSRISVRTQEPSLKPETSQLEQSIRRSLRTLSSRLQLDGLKSIWGRLSQSRFGLLLQKNIQKLKSVHIGLNGALFILAIAIYFVTRLIGLDDFPIYFFTDEAVQTNLAADFLRDGFRDYNGVLFPTYFENDALYNLSLSVYAQIIPYALFGKSIFVTRATSVVITILGAVAVGLILKEIFQMRFWWVGPMLLSITPAWFLHSRTAFETVIFVSLYAWVLLFYMLYRTRSAQFLYPTILLAGLAFYSYSGGQLVIAGTGLLLFISDLRYHWENRRTILWSLILVALFTFPYIRHQTLYSGETYYHLRMLDSYWLHNIPLHEKLLIFLKNYLRGISPGYWYWPNEHDLSRHLMKNYGHILPVVFPLAIAGLVASIRSFRSSEYRAVLVACLAAPLGGSIVGIGITRVLVFVVPAAILASIGLKPIFKRLAKYLSYKNWAISLFGLLAVLNFAMLRDALINGPTWYSDYGLGGMQYGGEQVFGAVVEHLEAYPGDTVFVSPSWANGTHILDQFFLPDENRVHLANQSNFINEEGDLDESTLLVLTPEEFAEAQKSDKLEDIRVIRTLPYPNGLPGFYFTRMRYSPEAEAIFAEEHAARLLPITEEFILDGQRVQIQHPLFDLGELAHLFDGDEFTFVRTYEANPALIILTFEQPRLLHGVSVTTGSMDIDLSVRVIPDEDAEPRAYSYIYTNLPNDPTVELAFGEGTQAISIEIEILGLNLNDIKVHLRELAIY
jgi:hypothetical protein